MAIGLSMAARPALARPEPPSREDGSPGGMERNDPGEPSAPAESAPSYGSERQDSNDASSSPDVSPPSSDRDHDRYSREAPDVGREHRGKEHDSDARPRGESVGHSSTLPADGEATAHG